VHPLVQDYESLGATYPAYPPTGPLAAEGNSFTGASPHSAAHRAYIAASSATVGARGGGGEAAWDSLEREGRMRMGGGGGSGGSGGGDGGGGRYDSMWQDPRTLASAFSDMNMGEEPLMELLGRVRVADGSRARTRLFPQGARDPEPAPIVATRSVRERTLFRPGTAPVASRALFAPVVTRLTRRHGSRKHGGSGHGGDKGSGAQARVAGGAPGHGMRRGGGATGVSMGGAARGLGRHPGQARMGPAVSGRRGRGGGGERVHFERIAGL
jgi:hypothetical protein